MSASPLRLRGLVVPGLFAAAAFTVLVGLGIWQLERKAWKEQLIETLTQRIAAPASALPPRASWARLSRAEAEFRRVTLRIEFIPAREGRVYTGGSALRADVSAPGYFVFSPARLADGNLVVVNRGYVASSHPNRETRPAARPEGVVEIIGVLRWPEQRAWFIPEHDRNSDVWFVRDHLAMSTAYDWMTKAPFYIEQEAPLPSGGSPRPGKLKTNLPNNHLEYALTWFGLAAALMGVFGAFAWQKLKESA
jgi:surfeit locus 1 family protein